MAGILPASTSTQSAGGGTRVNDLKDLDIDQFLQLMITELTNQDPLNPMDNAQLVQQIGEIRQISATTQLSETLLAVSSGQSLATASNLIGKKITALNNQNQEVTGTVESVTVQVDEKNSDKRTYQVRVGSSVIDLKNVRSVMP